MMIISLGVGILGGYLCFIYRRYTILIFGGLLGYVLIMILWSLFLHAWFDDSTFALWILVAIFCVMFSIIGY